MLQQHRKPTRVIAVGLFVAVMCGLIFLAIIRQRRDQCYPVVDPGASFQLFVFSGNHRTGYQSFAIDSNGRCDYVFESDERLQLLGNEKVIQNWKWARFVISADEIDRIRDAAQRAEIKSTERPAHLKKVEDLGMLAIALVVNGKAFYAIVKGEAPESVARLLGAIDELLASHANDVCGGRVLEKRIDFDDMNVLTAIVSRAN